MSFNLYRYFSGKQKWSLLLEALEYRISKRIPKDVRIKKTFLNRVFSSGIQLQEKNDDFLIDLPVNGKKNSFLLRKNSSDFEVFTQIILEEEYKPVVDLFNKLQIPINRFIDAGANAGFSSLYLSSYYPQAHFICLEPHPGNFAVLTRNISQNTEAGKFSLIQKALWNKHASLSGDNSFRDGKDWSFSVKEGESPGSKIEGITMNMLISENDLHEIDFLKIDIEGGEAQLFNQVELLASWIDKIKVMSIEIHDETKARFKIENTLQDFGFRLYNSGEITIAVNNKLVPLLRNK